MLKLLAISAALIFAITAVPVQNQSPHSESAQQSCRNADCANAPPFPVADNETPGHNEKNGSSKPDRWHKFVTWPEGITAWAIMCTLIAIVWQAYETRKAAAPAAISARAFINSERAWLITKPNPITPPVIYQKLEGDEIVDWIVPEFGIDISNVGKTIAIITEISIKYQAFTSEELPDTPVYRVQTPARN